MLCSYPEVPCPTGTIRTHSVLKYTLGFQLQLLRVNRQIYEEASSIFNGENGWVVVDVNKTGFGQDLEDHGYAVIYRKPNGRKIIEYPVLRISITFIGSHTIGGSDSFILSTAGINQLPRALWTLQNCNLMRIFYETSPDYTNHPAAARKVVRALSRLWTYSIIRHNLPPPGGRLHLPNWLPEGPPESGDVIALELLNARRVIEQYRRGGNAPKVVSLCEKSMAYLVGCYQLYGDLHVNTSVKTTRTIAGRIFNIALLLAEAQVALCRYEAVIKYCTYTIMLGNASFNAPPSPTTAWLGLVAVKQATKARIFLMRGCAYAKLGNRVDAWVDHDNAWDLIPQEESRSIEGFLEVMFKPSANKRKNGHLEKGRNVQAMKKLRISDSAKE